MSFSYTLLVQLDLAAYTKVHFVMKDHDMVFFFNMMMHMELVLGLYKW